MENGKKEENAHGDSDGATGATKIENLIHYPQEKHLKNIISFHPNSNGKIVSRIFICTHLLLH